MKKFLSLLSMLVLCLSLAAPGISYAATIKLNKTSLTLYEGNTYTLKLTGTTKTVKWSTSNKTVATVTSKGKITAVKAGKATITASVSTKKYTCKLTVKESFNAKKAIDSIDADVQDLGTGLVATLKNNYSFNFQMTATAVFYDSDGKMLGKSTADNYYFEKGRSCALYFYGPYDSNYSPVEYDSYKISYSVDAVSEYITSNVSDIKTNSNIGADNVMVEATNSGDKESEYTCVSIVFYKGDVVVGYDYTYVDVSSPGSTNYADFSFPYDSDYNTIQIDNYKVYVNYSYNYTW